MASARVNPRALKRVFVGNLPWTIGSIELKKYFAQFGVVSQAKVIFNRKTGFSRGYGFVQFQSTDSCEGAIKVPNHELEGASLTVQPATEA